MRPPSFRVGVLLVAGIVLGTFLTFAASSKPPVSTGKTGDLWEVTSQMSMEGMPMQMPSQKNKVCASKSWKEPPGAQNPQQQCQISDLKSVGAKTTWKMQCSSPTMTGDGEITRTSPDAYSGAIKMSSADGNVTIKLSGQKVGECDYAETEAMPAQAEAMSKKLDADLAKMQAEGCKGVAESLQLQILKLETGGCNDAATKEIYCDTVYSAKGTQALIKQGDALPGAGLKDAFDFCGNAKGKSAYCGQFNTPEGFELFASGGTGAGSPQQTIASYCGLSAAQVEDDRTKLCKVAAGGMTAFSYLAKFCPAEAKQLAEKECAGRNFTGAAPSTYSEFCGIYASQQAAQPAATAETPAEDTKKKTKKFFKSVWPH
jgi:uncharacterized protein DUF3617